MKVGVQRYGVTFLVDHIRLHDSLAVDFTEYEERKAGCRLGEMIARDFAFKTAQLPRQFADVHSLEVVVTTPKHYNELLRKADAWDALQ